MGARSGLSTTVDVLSRNQVLFVAALAAWLVNSVGSATQFVSPTGLVALVSLGVTGLLLFVTPFFEGGLLGMAREGLAGHTSLGTFTSEGTSNYLGLLAGRILMVGILIGAYLLVIVLGMVALFGFGAVGVVAGGLGDLGPVFLLVALALVVVGLLVVFTPLFLLQFYAPAIVVNDRGIVVAFKESYRLVRHNLVSVLGFDAVVILLSIIGALPTIGLFAIRYPGLEAAAGGFTLFAGASPSAVAGYFVTSLLLGVPITALFRTYQVTFFVDLANEEP